MLSITIKRCSDGDIAHDDNADDDNADNNDGGNGDNDDDNADNDDDDNGDQGASGRRHSELEAVANHKHWRQEFHVVNRWVSMRMVSRMILRMTSMMSLMIMRVIHMVSVRTMTGMIVMLMMMILMIMTRITNSVRTESVSMKKCSIHRTSFTPAKLNRFQTNKKGKQSMIY